MPSGARRLGRLVFFLALTYWFAPELSASPASLDGRVLDADLFLPSLNCFLGSWRAWQRFQPLAEAQVELRLAGGDSRFRTESDEKAGSGSRRWLPVITGMY